ncbi:MAG: ferritin [Bacteroidales bacterium]|nr:ferritin [Bacteroidales bacterium]
MLSKKIEKVLNAQVEKEFYSSNLYLAMASYTEVKGYPGVSQWLYAQAEEEKLHMMKFVLYINEIGGHAIIPALKQPPVEYGNIKQLFEAVLEHEQFITKSINDIVAACLEEKDFTTHNWIQWFVTEQVEEEASVNTILDKLALIGDNNLYLFDRDIMAVRSKETTV